MRGGRVSRHNAGDDTHEGKHHDGGNRHHPQDPARTMSATVARVPRRRRWFRWRLALPFLFAAASILQVGVLRFVDPPFSAFMAARVIEAWG